MNKKSLAALVILTGLAGLLGFACEEKGTSPVTDSKVHKSPDPVPEAVAGIAIRGRLEQTGSGGLVLASGGDRYDLISDADLSDLVGQTVKVTGAVAGAGALRVTGIVPVPEEIGSTESNFIEHNSREHNSTETSESEESYTKETSNEN